jgi:hypothetical protein
LQLLKYKKFNYTQRVHIDKQFETFQPYKWYFFTYYVLEVTLYLQNINPENLTKIK